MEKNRITIKNVLAALLGVFFMAIGFAMNNRSGLGNDPVGILYDGIRCALNLNAEQLGMASNAVNITLVVLLFFLGRRYISIGTLIYFIPYGTFVSIGNIMCDYLFHSETMVARIALSAAGCLILYLGIAIYIVVDIGTDPLTGLVLTVRDYTKKQYRIVKIAFDISLIILGTVLGGTLGLVTIITGLLGGPVIQGYVNLINRFAVGGRR